MNAFTRNLVAAAKQQGQDFEWYPTTQEILELVKVNMRSLFSLREDDETLLSVLDIGAGDGRALGYLTEGNRYAIEKSTTLLNVLPKDIFVLGTDFEQQTLIDKSVDVVFCNPPYSDFANWTNKIISEAKAHVVYLVIPDRWKNNEQIQSTIKARKAVVTVLDSFDFSKADRQARARVDVLRVVLSNSRYINYRNADGRSDAFDTWFSEHFKFTKAGFSMPSRDNVQRELKDKNELVESRGVIECLTDFYNRDLSKLLETYKAIAALDPCVLEELNVKQYGICESLKKKITGLKDIYWDALFNYLETITRRLTTPSRKNLLDKLTSHTHVDFNVANAHAVVIWVIKNANDYIDSQLVELVNGMVDCANITKYKSNLRTFGKDNWKYSRWDIRHGNIDLGAFALDYRVVLTDKGGIYDGGWHWEGVNGLDKRARDFINDVLVVAQNLGFDVKNQVKAEDFQWESNKGNDFVYFDHKTNTVKPLMSVKAFKNGNLHIKFNQKFIMQLNVEFGRLKGWLKSADDVAEEFDVNQQKARELFSRSNVKLLATDTGLLRLAA